MKLNNLRGLMALLLLGVLPTALFAQNATTLPATSKAVAPPAISSVFEYSDLSLSDPSVLADEPFTISVTVKNTGDKAAKHKVELLLREDSAEKGKRRQATKSVVLRPGQAETVAFTFRGKDLLKSVGKQPDRIVFYLGQFEMGVSYEVR